VDYLTFNNEQTGMALDVQGASKSAGALVDQWPSNGGTNQQWIAQVRSAARCSTSPSDCAAHTSARHVR